MDRSVVWRSGIVQALAVAVVAVILGAALPTSFFEEWGWLAGPAAWFACALLTARVVRLAWAPVLAGAALAGLPAILGVLAFRQIRRRLADTGQTAEVAARFDANSP